MIKIQKKKFNLTKENKKLIKKNTGAIVTFVGIVRRSTNKKKIQSIEIEHYPEMAKKEFKEIENKVIKKWKLNNCIIIHRFGKLKVGEKIVYIGTSSDHRRNAFAACEFLIDYLKTNAPFWKIEKKDLKEYYVKSKKSDLKKQKKWLFV